MIPRATATPRPGNCTSLLYGIREALSDRSERASDLGGAGTRGSTAPQPCLWGRYAMLVPGLERVQGECGDHGTSPASHKLAGRGCEEGPNQHRAGCVGPALLLLPGLLRAGRDRRHVRHARVEPTVVADQCGGGWHPVRRCGAAD